MNFGGKRLALAVVVPMVALVLTACAVATATEPSASVLHSAPPMPSASPEMSPSGEPTPTPTPTPSPAPSPRLTPEDPGPTSPAYASSSEYCDSLDAGSAYATLAGPGVVAYAHPNPSVNQEVFCSWGLSTGVGYATVTVSWLQASRCPVGVETHTFGGPGAAVSSQALAACTANGIYVYFYEYREDADLLLSAADFADQFALLMERADDAAANWG